ncbi:MAG: FAD-binding oxidoreductase [Alphaproteobacteria bacterium]|nr:FAD-binding oxidoreductase [Alphaproteobacteria bacterium]
MAFSSSTVLPDHAPSLWAATAPPAPETVQLTDAVQADVVIVGGGVTGLSSALHMAERGISAVVLEAARTGFGGSGRNSGHIIPALGARDPDMLVAKLGADAGERMIAFLRDSASLTFDLIRKYGIDCDAVQNGWAQPAHRASRMKVLERRYEEWTRRQTRVDLLDAGAIADKLGTDVYHGALFMRTGGHVNPLALAQGLARAAMEQGARVYTGSPALSVERADGKWRVATPSGQVIAERLVVATNAYTGALIPQLARSLVRIINYQVSTHPMPKEIAAGVIPSDISSSDTRADLYPFRKDRAGRLVTGATLALPLNMDARIRPWIAERIGNAFPQITDRRLEYVWNGRIALTPNRLPRIHEIGPGAISPIAYNGRGMAIGVAMGRELADWAEGKSADALGLPKLEITPMPFISSLGRLAQAALVRYRQLDARD